MNENELAKKEALRKEIVEAVRNEIEKLIIQLYYEQNESYCKKAVIQVAKDLGYDKLALNLIGK